MKQGLGDGNLAWHVVGRDEADQAVIPFCAINKAEGAGNPVFYTLIDNVCVELLNFV